MEIAVSKHFKLILMIIQKIDPFGKKTAIGGNKPKTQIKNKVSEKERMEAQAAFL